MGGGGGGNLLSSYCLGHTCEACAQQLDVDRPPVVQSTLLFCRVQFTAKVSPIRGGKCFFSLGTCFS